MEFSKELVQIAFMLLAALAVGGLMIALFLPQITGEAEVQKRVSSIAGKGTAAKSGLRARLADDKNEKRRMQIQESLEKFDKDTRAKKKRPNLQALIYQAGIDLPLKVFWLISLVIGVVFAIGTVIAGAAWYVAIGAGFAGFFGLPRWFLKTLIKRRQESFLNQFADAIDVMVRGLRAGLPVTDAMKVIATEMEPPVGPEFTEVVQGQRVGIPIDKGVERMMERMPLAEVNFLSIVMAIQKSTGGNLAEALANLSVVLRDRKKMKAKIRAVSQEAKASATIIGALPFVIAGGMMVLNPEYLNPLFETDTGHILLIGSGLWMMTGVLVMRKMINFNF